MGNNLHTDWYWEDWDEATKGLSWAEKGLWFDLIGKMYATQEIGVLDTFMGSIGHIKEVWPLLKKLATAGVDGVAKISVMIGTEMVHITKATWTTWREFEPEEYTPIEVVCRRMVKRQKALEKDRERQKKNKERKAQAAELKRNGSGIGAELERNRDGKEGENQTPPRARASLSSSLPPTTNVVVPPVTGGRTETSKKSKAGRVEENTELMVRIGAWFKRRPATLWAKEEAARLEELNPTEEEVELLERYYRSEDPNIARYRRHDLVTMLNNWTKECDWARRKLEGGEAAESVEGEGPRMVGMEMF